MCGFGAFICTSDRNGFPADAEPVVPKEDVELDILQRNDFSEGLFIAKRLGREGLSTIVERAAVVVEDLGTTVAIWVYACGGNCVWGTLTESGRDSYECLLGEADECRLRGGSGGSRSTCFRIGVSDLGHERNDRDKCIRSI